MIYRIGSFNCRQMGKASAMKKDLTLIARMINEEGFDVVALQEIHGKEALKPLLDTLNHESLRGARWAGEADVEVSDYGFVWNEKRLRKAETIVDGVRRVYEPTIYKQYRLDRAQGQKALRRNPYYARFESLRAPYVELRLINTHIRFSNDRDEGEGAILSAVDRRLNEFDVLARALFPRIEDKRYGNNKPAYTILLGDYNLNLLRWYTNSPYVPTDEEDMVYIIDGRGEKRLLTVQDKLSTLKKLEEDPEGREREKVPQTKAATEEENFSNNFDHGTYNLLRMRDGGVRVGASRVDISPYIKSYSDYRQTVSDHVPIIILLEL